METSVKVGQKLAPYNPTNTECIKIAIEMLALTNDDIVFDLGCGDGRFLIESKLLFPAIKVYGVEYDSELCSRAIANISQHPFPVEEWSIIHDNVLNVDFSSASALFIYLVPEGIRAVRPALISALERGVRIVTYVFSIPELSPTEIKLFKGSTKLYLYTGASLSSSTAIAVDSSTPTSTSAPTTPSEANQEER